jgi:Fur family ferric uptake transcriptional regulator
MPADDVALLLERLRGTGARVTTARRLVLTALVDGSRHPTADDLLAAVRELAPDIHASTVYRNLEELERLGVVVHTHLGHGPSTYHLAADAHGHFVCEQCGADFQVPESLLDALANGAREQLGFTLRPYHFAVLGLCAACAEAATAGSA